MVSDRTKDIIKSGGEWISSVELEGVVMAHPAVFEGRRGRRARRALGRAAVVLRRSPTRPARECPGTKRLPG